MLGYVIALAIVATIVVLAYLYYKRNCCAGDACGSIVGCALAALTGVRTDCGLYGASKPPAACPPGSEFYGSACYKPCPPGYTRTAACTCAEATQTETDCGKYGQSVPPNTCPPGTEFYGGACYKHPDLSSNNWAGVRIGTNYTRTAACSITVPGGPPVWTDCGLFGMADNGAVGEANGPTCPPDADLWGGLCYRGKCPPGWTRTASCTCAKGGPWTDCSRFGMVAGGMVGQANGPTCGSGSELWGGLCYSAPCPSGTHRTAPCSCQDN